MASSKQEGTSAAAEQLGSLSLGESAERKDKNNEDAEENEVPTTLCSACGEKSDALMKCRACKCVWYCDKDCQNKHWKEHKKECKPIKKLLDERGGKLDLGEELDVGPLGKLPPREECSICMQVLPMHAALQGYSYCCGKVICCGCDFHYQMKSGGRPTCAFCREPMTKSDGEMLARISKIARKDPRALCNLAMMHGEGKLGLSVDQAKCIKLLRESAGLGCPEAHYGLGNFHIRGEMGLERNEEKGIKYWQKAAEGGHFNSIHNLGCWETRNDNHVAAMRQWRLSASGGYRKSMESLIVFFDVGFLHHGDLAQTLQAFYRARSEMKSEDRDQHIAYLKRTGQYREEYNN